MKYIPLLAISLSLIFTSCNKDDDDNTNVPGSGDYKVEYKNQVLQGKINGEAWTFILGDIHSSEGGFNADYSHNFNMVDTAQSDSCFFNSGERSKVIFSENDEFDKLKVGKYPLSFDFNTFDGRTVTLVAWTETTVLNTIASDGEYEITSVDTVQKIVTGRMDAFADSDNYVNGNFTIKYCYWP